MSKKVKIKFSKLHPDARLPRKNYDCPLEGDSGYDVFSVEEVVIPAKGSVIVNTGVGLADITPGYWFKVEARSGLGFKQGILVHPGVVDAGYRGRIGIKLFNHSDQNHVLPKGYAVAQFILYELIDSEVEWSDVIRETMRGEQGFGSSDKKSSK